MKGWTKFWWVATHTPMSEPREVLAKFSIEKNMICAAVYWNTTKSYKYEYIMLTTHLMRYNLAIYTTRMRHVMII
jgi:hypothetical protein